MKTSLLLLLPNLLSEDSQVEDYLPTNIRKWIEQIDGIIAESEKGARAFLKRFTFSNGRTFRNIPIRLLNEHTKKEEVKELLIPIERGEIWGVVSDGGLPSLADPGAELVAIARQKAISIRAIPGPSSIFLALMLSGLCGQRFSFHGYLERELPLLKKQITHLECVSRKEKSTQIFIEAPYRSQKLYDFLVANLEDKTRLCVAIDLTKGTEFVDTLEIKDWKKKKLILSKDQQVVFLFYA